MAELKDHAMVTLAIKREGKRVDLQHIREKVSRDSGEELPEEEVKDLLDSLKDLGLIDEQDDEYAITDEGRHWFEGRWREVEKDLNQAYLRVYRAKRYYPNVLEPLLDFCKGRHVSVFRLFTGRSWLQRKLGKKYITIESPKDVQYWLNVHGIDFIPYIHRTDEKRPDWFIIDFDAGEKVGLEQTKQVVKAALDFLGDFGVESSIKFSGSRGFQTWTKFKPHDLPRSYRPLELRTGKRERNFFNFYADLVRFVEHGLAQKFQGLVTSEVARKEARTDKVLLDPSIYKPFGDVRAPYSIHLKTGLVSMPLGQEELDSFKPNQGEPERVAKRFKERGNEFKLEPLDGTELFETAVKWCEAEA